MAHMGKYPVIRVSLKSMKQCSYELAFEALKKIIKIAYSRHWKQIEESGKLTDAARGRDYLHGDGHPQQRGAVSQRPGKSGDPGDQGGKKLSGIFYRKECLVKAGGLREPDLRVVTVLNKIRRNGWKYMGNPMMEAKYLNVDDTDRYRPIIRLFYLKYEKLKYWLYQKEVFEKLKEDPYFRKEFGEQ